MKKLYVLYYFYEGIGDTYKRQGIFDSLEKLIEYHQKHRNTLLYDYEDYGKDYVETYVLKEPSNNFIIYFN